MRCYTIITSQLSISAAQGQKKKIGTNSIKLKTRQPLLTVMKTVSSNREDGFGIWEKSSTLRMCDSISTLTDTVVQQSTTAKSVVLKPRNQ